MCKIIKSYIQYNIEYIYIEYRYTRIIIYNSSQFGLDCCPGCQLVKHKFASRVWEDNEEGSRWQDGGGNRKRPGQEPCLE